MPRNIVGIIIIIIIIIFVIIIVMRNKRVEDSVEYWLLGDIVKFYDKLVKIKDRGRVVH